MGRPVRTGSGEANEEKALCSHLGDDFRKPQKVRGEMRQGKETINKGLLLSTSCCGPLETGVAVESGS